MQTRLLSQHPIVPLHMGGASHLHTWAAHESRGLRSADQEAADHPQGRYMYMMSEVVMEIEISAQSMLARSGLAQSMLARSGLAQSMLARSGLA